MNISILGSTGSIGTQALEVVDDLKGIKDIAVLAITGNSNVELLEAQARRYKPSLAVIADEKKYNDLKCRLADTNIKVSTGEEGLCEAATLDKCDMVLSSIVGFAGLVPTMKAIEAGKDIALANKETLVTAGGLFTDAVKRHNVRLLPVDSEHSAIFQCIQGKQNKIKKIWLTGSGGPFFGKDYNYLQTVTPEMAIKHPRWNMGKKISVDSASLMNKGLELIEAVHLFDVSPEQVEVVIHPQSIVHSLVEFEDNAILAQLGVPDMRVCIQYALTYPDRMPSNADSLDLFGKNLEFFKYDKAAFPLLEIAQESIRIGGNLPAVMNGANEEAVALFLDHKISFTKMFDLVIDTCESIDTISITQNPTLDDILASDKAAREYVRSHI